jgi:acyl-CoA dehydrogenase
MDADDFSQALETVRAFVREQVVPREDQIAEKDEIPRDIWQQAAALGLFGYALPVKYGGLGLGMAEDVRLAMEFGYTTPAFRSMFGTNNGIAGQVLVNYGTAEQKQRYLPRIAAGEAIASFALTESEAGSDPSGLRTLAVRRGDHYVINGSKRFITNAPVADVFMVFARTDPDARGTKGISVFTVDAGLPGLTVGPRDHKMGQSGAWTAEVFFDDVEVPATALIGGKEEAGFSAAMRSLARGRLHIAALCVGMAQRIIDESVRHAKATRQGGRPIAGFQFVQGMLAEQQSAMLAGRALVLDRAAAYDDGTDRRMGPACAKLFCSEMVQRVADRGVQVHGGMGYMRGVAVERFYRDARLFTIYEGTSEIQKLVIAKQLLDA